MNERPTHRRITIQVTSDLYDRVWACFQWGERNRILVAMLEWLCDKVESHGNEALLLLLREQDFDSLVKMREDENGND